MDLNTITVAQFKTQFSRDFPYLPVYDPTAVYNTGDTTYYGTNNLFYQALVDGVTGVTPGTDTGRWVKVMESVDNYIQDQDITNAFAEAQVTFNQGLFGTDAQITLGYLYMAAHWLCNDMKAALAGVNSTGNFPVSSKSAGSVSESYAIPQQYLDNPILAQYTQTAYGMKFLAMAMPNMTGNMVSVWGGSHP